MNEHTNAFVTLEVIEQRENPFLESKLKLSTRNPKAWAAIKKLMREQEEIDAKIERIRDANSLTAAEFCRLAREAQAERAAAVKMMTKL